MAWRAPLWVLGLVPLALIAAALAAFALLGGPGLGERRGVPGLGAGQIPPGGSTVYEFDALPAGPHLYHCHVRPLAEHIANGLYGAFIIDPADGREDADELVMVMNGFDTNFDRANEVYAANTIGFAYMDRRCSTTTPRVALPVPRQVHVPRAPVGVHRARLAGLLRGRLMGVATRPARVPAWLLGVVPLLLVIAGLGPFLALDARSS
jgi:hypothetical protein